MKKFLAYMVLAAVVYVLIYVMLLGYLRLESKALSEFCDSLQPGIESAELASKINQAGWVTAPHQMQQENRQLWFISAADNTDAVCQVLLEDEQVVQKKFVLSVF